MNGCKLVRMRQSGGAHELAQGGERALVKLTHARGLVVDHERALAPWVLRRDAGGATVGVAGLRLDAAEREHEAARGVAPVGPERQETRDIEGGHHPPACAEAD